MGYGLLISKPGINVGTATNPDDFIFRSDIDSMKTSSTGTIGIGTISHGLSYTPAFFIARNGFAPFGAGAVNVTATQLINASGTSRYYIFYKQF